MMGKVLVLGSGGQVGTELKKIASKNYIFFNKKKINVNDYEQIKNIIKKYRPKVILNLAAYTNVDKSENNKWDCLNTNYLSTVNLVSFIKKSRILYFYLSSDYVFDGKKTGKYKEHDKKNPLNFYGFSKSLCEDYIIKNLENYIILRTSWVYSDNCSSFLYKIIKKLKKNINIYGLIDSSSSPTSAFNLSNAIIYIIEKKIKNRILHFSDGKKFSPYKFIVLIKKIFLKSKSKIKKNHYKNLNFIAKRPQYSYLGISKKLQKLKVSSTEKEIRKYAKII
jgi:dTDP-4-dehydrorhamnose reductase